MEYMEDSWDMDDANTWMNEGNKFQNRFARQMFDCFAEILLLYVNNEKWDEVKILTRRFCPKMNLQTYYINHEA